MRRADRIRAIAERRRQRVVLFLFLKSRTGPPRYFGAVVRGSRRPVTDAEIGAAKRQNLAAWEQKRADTARTLAARQAVVAP